ncbi:hypothetical protein BDZ89DRAFT_1055520, partial [Hymenopellis radicata]
MVWTDAGRLAKSYPNPFYMATILYIPSVFISRNYAFLGSETPSFPFTDGMDDHEFNAVVGASDLGTKCVLEMLWSYVVVREIDADRPPAETADPSTVTQSQGVPHLENVVYISNLGGEFRSCRRALPTGPSAVLVGLLAIEASSFRIVERYCEHICLVPEPVHRLHIQMPYAALPVTSRPSHKRVRSLVDIRIIGSFTIGELTLRLDCAMPPSVVESLFFSEGITVEQSSTLPPASPQVCLERHLLTIIVASFAKSAQSHALAHRCLHNYTFGHLSPWHWSLLDKIVGGCFGKIGAYMIRYSVVENFDWCKGCTTTDIDDFSASSIRPAMVAIAARIRDLDPQNKYPTKVRRGRSGAYAEVANELRPIIA